jgi:hypothetical protein
VEADNYRYNEDVLDDPVLPSMRGESMDLKACLRQCELYEMLGTVTRQLGYEPNTSGTYSYRKYAISMVCRALGYHKATRLAQHNRASAPAVNAVYDNDNANEDIGAAEMGRSQETMEAVESLAETRVPAMGQFLTPGQVPRDSRAYKEELTESCEWVAANASVGETEAACKLARESGPKRLLKTAEAALKAAKQARAKLRPKLMHRVLVRHRLHVWKEGYTQLQLQASREQLQRLTDVCEYPTMSEAQAVVFHLRACAEAEKDATAKAAAAVRRKGVASEGVACAGMPALLGGDGGRSERRIAWRASRAEQQGFELEVDEVEAGPPSALASDAVVVPAELPATTMMAVSDVAAAPAELPTVVTWAAQQGFQLEVDEVDDAEEALPSGLPSDAVVAAAEVQVAAAEVQVAAMVVSAAVAELPAALTLGSDVAAMSPAQLQVSLVGASAAVPVAVPVAVPLSTDEALLYEYEQAMRDPAVVNAKRALSATYQGSERQMMRVLKRARLARK